MQYYKKIINKLINLEITLALAESCTGGLLSYSFVKHKGISKILKCGIVCYSDKSKKTYLNVSEETINKFGAVSYQVAVEMINGLYKKNNCKLCISTTGIAGPDGGSKNKPVGLVFIGIKYNNNNNIYKKKFVGSRIIIQKKTVEFIFNKINLLI